MTVNNMASKSVFKALADPTRRTILQLLRGRNMSAGELAEHFDSSKPTLSRHFSVLREADLVQSDRDGNSIIYRLNVSVLEETMLAMMEMFEIDLQGNENEHKQETDDQSLSDAHS